MQTSIHTAVMLEESMLALEVRHMGGIRYLPNLLQE
jgi:hypothetical protein